jgi:hypothetical protein
MLLALGLVAASAASPDGYSLTATATVDDDPVRVTLHYRLAGAGTFTEIDMWTQGDGTYQQTVAGQGTYEYWIDERDGAGTVLASNGSEAAPLTVQVAYQESWCDEPCSCGGQCGEPPPETIQPPRPRERRTRFAAAVGADQEPTLVADVELGYTWGRTELSAGFHVGRAPVALARVRARLGHRVLLGVAVGGLRTFEAGASAAVTEPLTVRTEIRAEATVLFDPARDVEASLAIGAVYAF